MTTIPVFAQPDHTPLIRLDAVSKRFHGAGDRPDFVAVDRVSLDIHAGERFGIIGSSGAGKSTLLRLINLLETPDAGSVHVGGEDLTRLSRGALRVARAGIGMIFQQFNLLQNASVHDNVAFPLTIQRPRLSRADRRARVDECLKIVGLTSKLDSYPAELSGGQKQRVAIARALATRPAVMLCDEPTSALDSETTRSVLDVLGEINAQLGVTLVVVTHELAVTRRLCQRVAVMADGRVVETIALDGSGDRLETAIARANRLADDRDQASDFEPSRIASEPVPFTPPPRRVGGLPMPGSVATVGTTSRAVTDAQAAAAARGHRIGRYAASSSSLDVHAPSPARRVGGLAMPGTRAVRPAEPPPSAVLPVRRASRSTRRVEPVREPSEAIHV